MNLRGIRGDIILCILSPLDTTHTRSCRKKECGGKDMEFDEN